MIVASAKHHETSAYRINQNACVVIGPPQFTEACKDVIRKATQNRVVSIFWITETDARAEAVILLEDAKIVKATKLNYPHYRLHIVNAPAK